MRRIFPASPGVGRDALPEKGKSATLTDVETREARSRGLADSCGATFPLQDDRPPDVVSQLDFCKET